MLGVNSSVCRGRGRELTECALENLEKSVEERIDQIVIEPQALQSVTQQVPHEGNEDCNRHGTCRTPTCVHRRGGEQLPLLVEQHHLP